MCIHGVDTLAPMMPMLVHQQRTYMHYNMCCIGKGKETLSLPAAEPTQRITYHSHSAPLHKLKTDNMLPAQLLTPLQVTMLTDLLIT